MSSSLKVGVVGISGYGGGEALRLLVNHPKFELAYAAGESSAGSKLIERFPGLPERLGGIVIQKWDPADLGDLDVLFASLPTGESREALAKVPGRTKIVDIGGDHRYAEGWVYGLADVWPEQIKKAGRVSNPGCYPAATLTALAPLVAQGLIEPTGIIVDAKSGVSGAGRGGGNTLGYAEVNEDVAAYKLFKHDHVKEMVATIGKLSGKQGGAAGGLTFTPHLIPMTRGILATVYGRAVSKDVTTEALMAAAGKFYAGSPFVRVIANPPHTKWATGTNLCFVSYAANPENGTVIALSAIDNLGKGAAGQAVQNANLMCGLAPETGLVASTVWP